MILDIALFAFVLLGSKLVLAAVLVHMLLPRDRTCVLCDAELIPLFAPRGARTLLRVLAIQRYWCVECDRHSLACTRGLEMDLRSGTTLPVAEVRHR